MNDLNYAYYIDSYKGNMIDEKSFFSFIREARNYLNLYLTQSVDASNNLNDCLCNMAEKIYKYADGTKASETVGNWSVSFTNNMTLRNMLDEVIVSYLFGEIGVCRWV